MLLCIFKTIVQFFIFVSRKFLYDDQNQGDFMAVTTTKTTQPTEGSKGIRGFKNSSDVENFYRFVFENNFRREAHLMLKVVHKMLNAKTKSKKRRTRKKLH